MNIRAPETKRGRYDDLIVWLKRFQNKLELWQEYRQAHGLFSCMMLFSEYTIIAMPHETALERIRDRATQRELCWIHVTEAWMDISHEMEGWTRIQPDQLRDHIENIRAAIRWFEQNNTIEDLGIKY